MPSKFTATYKKIRKWIFIKLRIHHPSSHAHLVFNKYIQRFRSGSNEYTPKNLTSRENKELMLFNLLYEASKIDPQISSDYFIKPSTNNYIVAKSKKAVILEEIYSKINISPDYIFLLPWLKRGGADWVTIVLVNILLKKRYNVLIITTESEDLSALPWIDSGDNFNIVTLSKHRKLLTPEDYISIILHICVQTKPRVIHNVNSLHAWCLYRDFHRQLSIHSKLCASAFCHDYDEFGNNVGYIARYLKDLHGIIDIILTDNLQIIKEISEDYGLTKKSASKLHYLYFPSRNTDSFNGYYFKSKERSNNLSNNKPVFLWAGRICSQKRPDLLVKIAESNPHINFVIRGYLDDESPFNKKIKSVKNIIYKGKFNSFNEIIDPEFSGLLYTSSWDGLPNVLIEATCAGLPVIASNVGGIGELIFNETGFLINNIEDIEEYSKAMHMIINQNDQAVQRAKNAFDLVSHRHTIGNIENTLNSCNYFI